MRQRGARDDVLAQSGKQFAEAWDLLRRRLRVIAGPLTSCTILVAVASMCLEDRSARPIPIPFAGRWLSATDHQVIGHRVRVHTGGSMSTKTPFYPFSGRRCQVSAVHKNRAKNGGLGDCRRR